ncbi:reverse transcriptase domain-containing protein [Tanacetum coccineum]|uniref:Reverse transcriptase domain-containing protein n=1 Tax=Tanacetum coccineum TaxID=301880 RepID=A0ABQ5CDX5_9ASTR
MERPEEESPDEPMAEPPDLLPKPWTLFTDGSSCIDGSGVGLILINPEGVEFTYAIRFRFEATNNEAEYEALIACLRIVEQIGVKNLQENVDSRLVANQVNGSYVAKDSGMVQYLEKVKTITSNFKEFFIKQVPQSENKKADALSKIESTSFAHLSKQVLMEELKEKSINEKEVLAIVEEEGLIRECSDCQVYRPIPRNPQQNLTPITSPWPFYKWGIDTAGPFPEGPGKVKFLIVVIDYFTKWIEAKPIATIMGNQVKKFVWDNIVCRFGLPGEIAYCTMIKSSNGKTSFSLTYDTEAVIPAEIGMLTLQTAEIDLMKNDEALEINLDLIEEKREQATIQEAKSKATMEKYYNSKVRGTSFKPRDMVYHNNNASHS